MEENDAFEPSDYLAVIKRRKWHIIVPIVTILLLSVIIAFALPPIYKSTTTILIEQQDVPLEYVRSSVSTYAEQQMQIINQRIMSSTRLLEIINRLNLYTELKDTMMTEEIIEEMRKNITLEPISVNVVDPKTGRPSSATIAFTISYQGKKDPGKVLQVANVLASLFLEENSQVRERQATEVSKFLQDEMTKVKTDLGKIDAAIAAFKQKNVNDLPELVQVNMQSINDIERNIDMLNNQLTQLREKEGYMTTQLAGTPADFMQTDRQRLGELKVRLVNLKQQFSDEHPDVINTKAEIAELEKRLKASPSETVKGKPDNPAYITLSSQLAGTRSEIATITAQIRDLNARLSDYRRRIAVSPQVESEYKTLLMERSNTQAKFDDLTKKFMESRVSQGLEKEKKGERFTIIDPARLPEVPYKPNRAAIMLIGLVLGIGAGIGTASFKEFTDSSVHSARTLSQLTSYPVLASIPLIALQDESDRRKTMGIWIGASLMVFVVVGLVVFNYFIMDLDILWVKVLGRFGR